MARIETDPLDGPELDTSDPAGTVKEMVMFLVGAGVFFALLAAAQSTVTPVVSNIMSSLPGVSTGADGSQTIRVG